MVEIVDYELWETPLRWQFLRLETSDGLVGWGEPVVEGRAPTVAAAVEELLDTYLVGEDPNPIEDHWQAMYRGGFYRGGPVLMSAISGIDQALWDIKGKRFGAPVHELLGGRARDRVRLYAHFGGDTPEAAAESAEARVEEGFDCLKTTPVDQLRRVDTPAKVQAARERLRATREAVGPDVDIALDFHGRVTKPMAKRLFEALEEFDPMFYEEPVLSQQNDALPHVTQYTSVPIATGERMFSRWDFKEVFEQQTVDIVQPDLSHAGGITEVKKIADMAEAYDVALAPHSPLGPVALAASLQVDACSPNALVQEQIHHNEGTPHYLTDPSPLDHEDGYVAVPEGPGLGVEPDPDALDEAAERDAWEVPKLRNPDGSVTEW